MHRLAGLLAAALIFLSLTAESNSCANKNNNNSSGAAAPASTAAPVTKATTAPATSRLGETIKVGDLDLTVSNPRAIDTKGFNQFNREDYGVDVQIADTRGDKYSFSPAAMKVIDTNGVVHQGSYSCTGCPNFLGSTDLVKGGHASGTVYFAIGGSTPKELQYQAFASSNRVTILLQ